MREIFVILRNSLLLADTFLGIMLFLTSTKIFQTNFGMVFVLGKTENSSLDQSQPVFVAYDSFSMRVHILCLKCADIIVPVVFMMQYYDSI